ncbi:MAG: hypothetical protein ABFS05_03745 [Bacteroidota bacterium]
MKNKATLSLPKKLILCLYVLVFVSCNPEDDTNPSPVPDVRDKFIAEWNVSDACSKGNYIVTISKDPSNTAQVLLQNFAGSLASQPDTAIVAASSIVLFQQTNSEGWQVKGSGSYLEDGSIDWVFTLVISGYEESCTATYVRGK